MKHLLVIAAAISSTVFIGCKKEATTTGNNNSPSENISFEMNTENATSTVGRTAAGTVAWTGGYATVSEIKFDAKGDDKLEYRSSVTRKIDLFNALSNLGGITIPNGTYRKIKIKIGFEPTSSSSALELRGAFTPNNGLPVPVILRFDKPFELKYDVKDQITIDDSTKFTVLNTLPLNVLVNGITEAMLNNADRDANGAIVVSSQSNTDLYNPIWSAFQSILKVKFKKK